MSKPGKGLDAWDIVRAMTDVEPYPSKMAYILLKDGAHQLIDSVYIDQDGDLIFLEEGGEPV